MAPLLHVESSTKRFGGLLANREVSLSIEAGEIVGLIGPNGAGKTTLFNCITGYMHPDEGRIVFDAGDITHTRPERICRLGVARTWQVVRAFGRMTALENVVCGALQRTNRIAEARARPRAARLHRSARPGRRARRDADTGRQKAARDRPRAGHATQAAAARRSDVRTDTDGDRGRR